MELASSGASPAPPPELPSWWGTIVAVIAGSIAAWALLIVVALPLALLNVIPVGPSKGHRGWPWRIDGAWSIAADLGPTLAAGIVVASCVAFYMESRTGVRPRRWPLALVAVAVGWLPVTGGARGLLAVSGTVAFVAIVFTARRWALAERRPLHWTRPAALATLAAGLLLAAVSVSYGALHPLTAEGAANGPHGHWNVALKDGRSGPVTLSLRNRGPLNARIVGVSVPGAPDLRVGPAPQATTIKPGTDLTWAQFSLHTPWCSRVSKGSLRTVQDLDFRLRVAGVTRTQRVHLSPPLRVICR